METNKPTTENQTPEWLKTIQLNSWEAELLISALVLYALFQLPEFLETLTLQKLKQGSLFHGFFGYVIQSIKLLRIGYILHIMVRGLWVASVGLSYVFPNGVNQQNLGFRGKFKKELESTSSLVDNVLRLEQLSSTIYGVSFLLFGMILGFATMSFTLILFVTELLPFGQDKPWLGTLVLFVALFYVLSGALLLLDFLTAGLFRRKKWAVEWFYPVAKVFRILTLSFLYRRSLLALISNVHGWRSKIIPIIILAVIVGFDRLEHKLYQDKREAHLRENQAPSSINANFENLRDLDDYLLVTLQSDIIGDNALKVFMRDVALFRDIYNKSEGKVDSWTELSSSRRSNYLSQWINIKIDSIDIPDPVWFKTQHTRTYDHGFNAYLDIENLERGHHSLAITIDTLGMDQLQRTAFRDSKFFEPYFSNINFFYDKQ